MLAKEKLLMILSIVLLFFAAIACVSEPPVLKVRYHDFHEGLDNWRCIVNDKTEQETKYSYNERSELESIEFFLSDKPIFITSYLEYVSVKDSLGHEVKYRYCSKRIHYNEINYKRDWEEIITIAIINNKPKIKSLTTNDGVGQLKYHDEYEYDEKGRKKSATRTFKDNTYTKYEYTYSDGKNLGVRPEEYYFEIPRVYYNLKEYINWCTLATETLPTVQLE